MKTLEYLNLNENSVANVVVGLQNLLADFQVYYTNLRGFHWKSRDAVSLSSTKSSKACMMMRLQRSMNLQNVFSLLVVLRKTSSAVI